MWTDGTHTILFPSQKYFRYGEFSDLDARAIELPYEDSDMSMLIILPNRLMGLARLESQLKRISIQDLSSSMNVSELELDLPKFKIEFEVSLVDALAKVNATQMRP